MLHSEEFSGSISTVMPMLLRGIAAEGEKRSDLRVRVFARPAFRDTPRPAAAEDGNLAAKRLRPAGTPFPDSAADGRCLDVGADDFEVARQKQVVRLRLQLGRRELSSAAAA